MTPAHWFLLDWYVSVRNVFFCRLHRIPRSGCLADVRRLLLLLPRHLFLEAVVNNERIKRIGEDFMINVVVRNEVGEKCVPRTAIKMGAN